MSPLRGLVLLTALLGVGAVGRWVFLLGFPLLAALLVGLFVVVAWLLWDVGRE